METASDNADLRYPEWQGFVRDALVELDGLKLEARVAAAESAILVRMESLSKDNNHHAERLALEDALCTLRVLKKGAGRKRNWQD
jgi:hypothetical protein